MIFPSKLLEQPMASPKSYEGRQFSKLWQEGSMVFVCNVIDSYDIFYIAGRVI